MAVNGAKGAVVVAAGVVVGGCAVAGAGGGGGSVRVAAPGAVLAVRFGRDFGAVTVTGGNDVSGVVSVGGVGCGAGGGGCGVSPGGGAGVVCGGGSGVGVCAAAAPARQSKASAEPLSSSKRLARIGIRSPIA